MSKSKLWTWAAIAVGIGAVVYLLLPGDGGGRGQAIAVSLPGSFSAKASEGEGLFNNNCATCHGPNGAGSEQGPPLIHRIYEPNHHADLSFILAARNGVRAHHWNFGNMAPVPGVSEQDVKKIVAYIREIQRANGIR